MRQALVVLDNLKLKTLCVISWYCHDNSTTCREIYINYTLAVISIPAKKMFLNYSNFKENI